MLEVLMYFFTQMMKIQNRYIIDQRYASFL